MSIRILIVDDEELARRGIRARLAVSVGVEIVGEAHDAISGLAAIESLRPDLVFLDIEMPGADGLSMIGRIPEHTRPLVVFVTAHEDRALDAFGVQALDYVLKPIDGERIAQALDRARTRLVARGPAVVERIMIRDRGRVVALEPSSIDWVQSDGDYVRIFAGRRTFLHQATISAFAEDLPTQFVRVHRAAVVNVERIVELTPLTHGDCSILLSTGARLKLARTRRAALAERMGSSF